VKLVELAPLLGALFQQVMLNLAKSQHLLRQRAHLFGLR